jgi:hypothetical protein
MGYSGFYKNLKTNYTSSLFCLIQILFGTINFAIGQTVPQPNLKSITYRFQSETVWDKLDITVEDFHEHFRVKCQSDNAINGWVLTRGDNDDIISSSDKSPGDSFQIDVKAPFISSELTVLVNNDTQEIPMVISLRPEKEQIWITPTPGPQPTPSENDLTYLLDQAQKLENGEKHLEALKLYLTVLKLEPHNKTATIAVARIQDEVLAILIKRLEHHLEIHNAEAAQSGLTQIKKLIPTDKRIADWQKQIDSFSQTSSQSRKAKADETYNLGLDSYRKDDYSSAKKFWEETLQIDPNYLQARQNLDRLNQEHPGL